MTPRHLTPRAAPATVSQTHTVLTTTECRRRSLRHRLITVTLSPFRRATRGNGHFTHTRDPTPSHLPLGRRGSTATITAGAAAALRRANMSIPGPDLAIRATTTNGSWQRFRMPCHHDALISAGAHRAPHANVRGRYSSWPWVAIVVRARWRAWRVSGWRGRGSGLGEVVAARCSSHILISTATLTHVHRFTPHSFRRPSSPRPPPPPRLRPSLRPCRSRTRPVARATTPPNRTATSSTTATATSSTATVRAAPTAAAAPPKRATMMAMIAAVSLRPPITTAASFIRKTLSSTSPSSTRSPSSPSSATTRRGTAAT